ncbi:hypothetical protein BDM02DRAFT_1001795 [Thelephora ganbajun]|uniref:Uncharacterized protein n=1 Tax=Thelephora ganbajun TaxID=370292 RepID=A0ACB6ZMU6_THEGA|nr:hypothetical protein BDM02DRAFT_1001795 [Thelephora ganbajun]
MPSPSSPALTDCSVLSSSVDPMPSETPETFPIGPQHIGQVDGPREVLNVVDQVHSTGVRAYVDVPTICALGDQSVGKSSVIEAISGVKLPRALDTCTRCPMHCRLSQSSEPWKCAISLNFHSSRSVTSKNAVTIQFGGTITDRSQVEERVRRAQRAVLSPNTDHALFLDKPEEECPPAELTFTSDYVQIEISDRNLTNLSFFDLPGLIANAESGNEGDIQLVENLVTDYISRDSCLILLTIACECDFMTQQSYQLAQKYDPTGARTIGVLTKPDRCPAGSEGRWLDFVRGKRNPILKNGWFVVKRPDTPGLLSGITWEAAQSQEEKYFSTTQPWCTASMYRSNYGSQNLVGSLSVLLCEVIKRRLPELRHELRSLLVSTRASLTQLPEQTRNYVAKASKMIGDFLGAVEKHLEGAPGRDGLHQSIRQSFREFTAAIRASAPDFRPYPSSVQNSFNGTGAILPYPDFVVKEDKIIYLDEVKDLANVTRSRELPDHCPFQLLEDFANRFVGEWETPADVLLDKIFDTLRAHLDKIISQHFPDDMYPVLSKDVKLIVRDILFQRRDTAKERITWQIESERKGIFTLNEEDLYSHKKDFECACKDLPSFKRLSVDVKDPAISIMGTVRGYFHVSHRRFLDSVPLAINHELIYGLIHPNRGKLQEVLYERLRINGVGADAQCEKLLQEPPNVQVAREDLSARYERLSAAATALESAIY